MTTAPEVQRPRDKGAQPHTGGDARDARPLRLRLGRLGRRRRLGAPGPVRRRRRRHLPPEERARVDAGVPAQGAAGCSSRSPCRAGARTCRASTSTTSSTSCAPRRSRPPPGTTCPRTSRTPTTSWASRRPRRPAWSSGVAAQYESEVVYHQIREDLEEQGVIFLDTDTGAARAAGAVPGVLRLGDPGRRQQVLRAELGGVVGRVVHLRAAGRARRHPAAGLLPDQHREHGPVRAHADHRRRGRVRALRRGLHRADLQVGLAALRGGRDHREEGRPLPLHDDPELVEQRLQPGHQAGQGRTRARPWSGSTATSAPR